MARFLVAARLSERMAETPEGFLLCRDVPIARTGALEYLPTEVSITPAEGADLVTVYRFAEDLFEPAAVASFEGKPFCLDHPDEDVGPENWRDLAAGHLQNVRRGTGPAADLLLADILVTAAEAIRAIRKDGLREVSCGYDAEYVEIAPGVGRQTRIRGNHLALVDAGRCGPRCAIKDSAIKKSKDTTTMTKAKRGLLGMLLGTPAVRRTIDANPKVRKALDEAIAEEVKDEDTLAAGQKPDPQPATDEGERTADDIGEIKLLLRSLLEKLDGAGAGDPDAGSVTDGDPDATSDSDEDVRGEDVEDEDVEDEDAGGGTEARGGGTADRARRPGAGRRTADAALVRDVAILAPSLAVGRGDPAAVVKRLALRQAMRDGAIRRVVDAALGRADLDTAPRSALDVAFASAVEVARVRTNGRTADALAGRKTRDAALPGGKTHDTPASLNKMFADHRRQQKG